MKTLISRIILLVGLALVAANAAAEVFPFRVGPLGRQPGLLEVAKDPQFQKKLVSITLSERDEYLINFPETSVYYVRIRQEQTVVWNEAVLILLEPSGEDRFARLSWTTIPEAARYRLWVSRSSSRAQWFETQQAVAGLRGIGAPWLIRLRGITPDGRLLPAVSMNFRWTPVVRRESKSPSPEPIVRLDLSAPDDDQVVYEPDDKELLSGADEGPLTAYMGRSAPSDLPPVQRKHELYGWLRYLREEFSIDKKDRFEAEPSTGLGTGAGGQYFLAPNLSLSAAIDTHATRTDYEAGGAQAPNTEQKRIRFHVAMGLDLLNTHSRSTDWSLMIGPAAGLVQMPLQENDQKFTDYGLNFGTQHYPSRIALTLLFLKSGSREIHSRWIAPWTIWSVQPFLGLYLYNTRQSAGAVTGRFQESGLRFGLARDF